MITWFIQKRCYLVKNIKSGSFIRIPEDSGINPLKDLNMSTLEKFNLYRNNTRSLNVLNKSLGKNGLTKKKIAQQGFDCYRKLREAMITGNGAYVESNAGKKIVENFVKDVEEGQYLSDARISFENPTVELLQLETNSTQNKIIAQMKIGFEGICEISTKTSSAQKLVAQNIDLFCIFGEQKLKFDEETEEYILPWKVIQIQNKTPNGKKNFIQKWLK